MIDEIFEATRQAEIALLGALLIEATRGDNQALDEVKIKLKPDDFISSKLSRHSRIYRAMLNCTSPVNQIVVAQKMNEMGILEKGDCAYLCRLVAQCPCSLDYMIYAFAVKEYSEIRRGKTPHFVKGAI